MKIQVEYTEEDGTTKVRMVDRFIIMRGECDCECGRNIGRDPRGEPLVVKVRFLPED